MTPGTPLQDLSGAVEALTTPLARELNHALLQVYAYIQPPYGLADDESYQVDLTRRTLTILYGGQAAFEAPVQVLGSWNREDGSWLWPRANSSLHPEVFEPLFARLSGVEGAGPLMEADRFALPEPLTFPLAAWLARESGCFGAYPAVSGDGLYVFLALEEPVGLNGYSLKKLSCCFCYRDSNSAGKFIPVGEHLGLCSDCIRNFAEVALLDFPGSDLDAVAGIMESDEGGPDTHPATPCVACGYDGKRIFGSEASLCYQCLAACGAAIGPL